MNKKTYKVFERSILLKALQDCLNEGFIPLNGEEISKAIKNKLVPNNNYDSRTLLTIDNVFRDATLKELKNIEKTYKDCGRLVWFGRLVDLNLRSYAYGSYYLVDGIGRLVGVKSSETTKKNVKP